MRLFALLAPVWAFWGMVSCDDPDVIAARVRATVNDPAAWISCQEPRAWKGEDRWLCTSDLRGARTCFSLRDPQDSPASATCPSSIPKRARLELP